MLVFAAVGSLCCGLRTAQAQGDDHAAGRAFAIKGFKAYKKSDYATALEAFDAAHKVYPAGQVLRMYGYTLLALERWIEAHTALEQALAAELKPLAASVRSEVRDNIDKARSHIAMLTIRSDVPQASVMIDGGTKEALPIEARALVEGAHQIEVTAPGYDDVARSIDLRGGSSPAIDIEMDATEDDEEEPVVSQPPAAFSLPSWLRPAAMGSVAVGLTSLGAGIATLVAGRSASAGVNDRNAQLSHQLATACPASRIDDCYRSAELNHRDGQRAYQLEAAGVSLMISGAVLAAAGAGTLVFLGPKNSKTSDTALRCLPAASGEQAPFGLSTFKLHCSLKF
jgi:tetratricopeptide (TPR) repeat protein